jgi:hypothetical protein
MRSILTNTRPAAEYVGQPITTACFSPLVTCPLLLFLFLIFVEIFSYEG